MISETIETHLLNLQIVLDRLWEANLQLDPNKCSFASSGVDYLGYHVSAKGLSTRANKTEAIANSPHPVDVKSLRSFLGLASYCRRFILCFSKVASHYMRSLERMLPLTGLKQCLISATVLAFP